MLFVVKGCIDTKCSSKDSEYPVDTDHNNKTYYPPHHVVLAFFSFFCIVCTTDKLHNAPDKDNKGNNKGKLYERVDDSPVDTKDYFIETLSIGNGFEHESNLLTTSVDINHSWRTRYVDVCSVTC